MKRLVPFLLFLMVIFSGSAFAYTSVENCGMTDDGKTIKPYNSEICPQNLTQKMRIAFFGQSSFTSLLNGKDSEAKYNDVLQDMSESQRAFVQKNSESYGKMKFLTYGIGLTFVSIIIIISLAIFAKAMIAGEHHKDDNGNEPRYNIYVAFGTILAGIACFIPGFYGNHDTSNDTDDAFSVGDFALNVATYGDLIFQNEFISTYMNRLQTGFMDVAAESLSVLEGRTKMFNSHTYYSARATVAGLVNASLVITASSAYNNAIENLDDHSTGWKVRDVTADVWQPNDDYGVDFEHRFSEDPNQTMWSADPITFVANPESIGDSINYLKAVNYNKSYRKYDQIDNLYNQAEKLKTDIQTTSFYNNEAGFKEIANEAVTYFFRDAQANILQGLFPDYMAKSDEIALLRLNYVCSKDKSTQHYGQLFIDAHVKNEAVPGGNSNCVTADWKLMGQNKPEFYSQQVVEKTQALVEEYYNVRIKINTQFQKTLYSTDLVARMKEVVQKGPLFFFWALPGILNDAKFTATVQNQFAITSPVQTIQTKAMDTYVDDAWAKAHGYPGSTFKLSDNIRDASLNVPDVGTPTIKDSQAIIQKQFAEDYTASQQNSDFLKGLGIGLADPQDSFDRCRNSSIHPITCLQQYGQSISETMVVIAEMAVTLKMLGYAATYFGDKKKGKLESEQEKADKAAGISKSKLSKIEKKKRDKPVFLQKVGAIMSAFANFFLKAALIGYIFAVTIKFLMSTLMIGPFFILYVLNMLYTLILILTSSFALIAFLRYNDKNNLVNLVKTLWAAFLSCFVMGTVILIVYTINWELAGMLDKNFSPIIAHGFSSSIASGASGIINHISTLFVSFICYMAINVGVLRYSLKAIQSIGDFLGISVPYLQHGERFLTTMIQVTNVLSLGIFSVLDNLIGWGSTRVMNFGKKQIFKKKHFSKGR